MIALTHVPSPRMEDCARTFIERFPIDCSRTLAQHVAYCRALHDCGVEVRTLEINRDWPDAVFIEDTAIVLDELAILASMGAESRRNEPLGLERDLSEYRQVRRIEWPATLEGGDVLRIGRKLLVGLSSRTNSAGVEQLKQIVRPHGYEVILVPVRHCLHLKTACTALPDATLLINRAWVDVNSLGGFDCLNIPESEPWAANVALVSDKVLVSADHVQTASLIRERGFEVREANISEFAKAEGGVTCLSLLFEDH